MRLLTTFAAAAGLLIACASVPRRGAPPPKTSWAAYLDSEVKGWKNAHDYNGAPLCQRCHTSREGGLVVPGIAELCYQCHAAATMTHVNKIQKPPPKTLPYEAGGRIVCTTCHEVHDLKANRYGFRLPGMGICLECHQRH
jgi:predicted CXXCH cytochrome family protein